MRSEEEALRSEEEALRSEEEALRSEEEALRSKEEALRSEEEALRSEEEALEGPYSQSRPCGEPVHYVGLLGDCCAINNLFIAYVNPKDKS